MEILNSNMFWLALMILPVAAGFLLANRETRLERYVYNQQLIAVAVCFFIGMYLVFAFGAVMAVVIFQITKIVLSFIVTRWAVYRLQDCGWNRLLALILLVPAIGFLILIVLMFPASRREGQDVDAAIFS